MPEDKQSHHALRLSKSVSKARKLAAIMFSDTVGYTALMGWYYDIHPDGDEFVIVKGGEIDTKQNHINIIKNFTMEIEKRFAAAM